MSSSQSSPTGQIVHSSDQLMTIGAFHAITWTGFALCVIAYSARIYVRLVAFGRLLIDDWLMLVALVMLLATAILGQLVLKYIYTLMEVGNGEYLPGPTFLDDTATGLHAFGAACLLWYIGIWIIKFNFLIFFYRLGGKIREYLIFWWIVLVLTIGCGALSIGIMQFNCLFGPIGVILTTCNELSSFQKTYTFFKISCIVDVITDAFIVCFPVSILWRIRISIRKKVMLSGIFGLVAFTMAVTIVRGSIFGGTFKTIDENNFRAMNVTWIWFWFSVEFTVSFIIACLVSFRALFTQKEHAQDDLEARQYQERKKREEAARPRSPAGNGGLRGRLRNIHDSLLDTCRTLEGADEPEASSLPADAPDPDRVSVDFSHDGSWREGAKSMRENAESVRTVEPAQAK
ncbi:hypothetical protein B0T22DRAFT_40136 [Podospora appendiculata]|uniref:Rhodopsin domain-containing protein n=1 Tax=Podospora appendiculata TaxID=314037 RepID=A0AAE0XHE8_9PEZI|nr:hypothetical protein B0T22DRAFT_40136 [Podospora appendiculata]